MESDVTPGVHFFNIQMIDSSIIANVLHLAVYENDGRISHCKTPWQIVRHKPEKLTNAERHTIRKLDSFKKVLNDENLTVPDLAKFNNVCFLGKFDIWGTGAIVDLHDVLTNIEEHINGNAT